MRIWSLLGLALQLDGSYLALSLSWRLEGARALAGYRAPKSPAAGQLACQPRRVVAKRKRKQKRKQKPIAWEPSFALFRLSKRRSRTGEPPSAAEGVAQWADPFLAKRGTERREFGRAKGNRVATRKEASNTEPPLAAGGGDTLLRKFCFLEQVDTW